jgi:hypothetical protein
MAASALMVSTSAEPKMLHHRCAVGHAKRLSAPIEERSTREPSVEQCVDGRAQSRSRELLPIGDRKARFDRLTIELDAGAFGQPQPRLDQSKLKRLKARSGKQVIAKIEEICRRHSLEHVELGDQQLQDLVDARERVHDARHRFVADGIGRKVPLDAVELVQSLLEPKLVGLVDDDEQHLVVHR